MIVKGGSRSSASYWSKHLLRTDHNESVEILEMPPGFEATQAGLYEILHGWQDLTKLTAKGKKGFYCGHIDPDGQYDMAREDWQAALAIKEAVLGYQGQPRIVAKHTKDGREHIHVLWQRARVNERGQWELISDSWNYKKHEQAARRMEVALGHERVKGAFTGRDRDPETGRCLDERPVAELNHKEWQQGMRTGKDVKAVKAEIAKAWGDNPDGGAFKSALEQSGYTLAQGDRKPVYMVVDRAGEAYELRRCVKGVKKPEIEKRLAAYPVHDLQTVATVREAIRQQQRRQGEQEQQRPPVRLRESWLKGDLRAANDNSRLRAGQAKARKERELAAEIAVPMQRRQAMQGAFAAVALDADAWQRQQLIAIEAERERYEEALRTQKRQRMEERQQRTEAIEAKAAEVYTVRADIQRRHFDDMHDMEVRHQRQTAMKQAELDPYYGRSIKRLERGIAKARERLEHGGKVYGLLFAWRDRHKIEVDTMQLEHARQREASAWAPLRNKQREEREHLEKLQADEMTRTDRWVQRELKEFEQSLDAPERGHGREQGQDHNQQHTRGSDGGGMGRSRSLGAQASPVKSRKRKRQPVRVTGRDRRKGQPRYKPARDMVMPDRRRRYTTGKKITPRTGINPRQTWRSNARELVQAQRTPTPQPPGYRPAPAPRPGFMGLS